MCLTNLHNTRTNRPTLSLGGIFVRDSIFIRKNCLPQIIKKLGCFRVTFKRFGSLVQGNLNTDSTFVDFWPQTAFDLQFMAVKARPAEVGPK